MFVVVSPPRVPGTCGVFCRTSAHNAGEGNLINVLVTHILDLGRRRFKKNLFNAFVQCRLHSLDSINVLSLAHNCILMSSIMIAILPHRDISFSICHFTSFLVLVILNFANPFFKQERIVMLSSHFAFLKIKFLSVLLQTKNVVHQKQIMHVNFRFKKKTKNKKPVRFCMLFLPNILVFKTFFYHLLEFFWAPRPPCYRDSMAFFSVKQRRCSSSRTG